MILVWVYFFFNLFIILLVVFMVMFFGYIFGYVKDLWVSEFVENVICIGSFSLVLGYEGEL